MTTELAICTHRWFIGSPNGIERSEKVPGRCRLCGTEREFYVAHQDLRRMTQKASVTMRVCNVCQESKRLNHNNFPRRTFGGYEDTCRDCRTISHGTVGE